jgi:hypothetical protein
MLPFEVSELPSPTHGPRVVAASVRSRAGLGPTTCEEQAVRDTDWLEPAGDGDEDAPRRARPLLLALASLPWLVVIGLLVLPGRMPADEPQPDQATDLDHADALHDDPATSADPVSPAEGPSGDDDTEVGAVDGSAEGADGGDPDETAPLEAGPVPADPLDELLTLEGRELRGRWRVEAGPEEAVALAVVAGRAWLTGVEPVLDLGFDADRPPGSGYAEHLVVEAVEQPAPDALVITLVAVVLDTGGGAPSVRRLAVPVAATPDGPRLAGPPWELPPPVFDQVTLPREATEDEASLDAARAALLAAGLTELDLVALHRTSGWPVIAEVATPGADRIHEVWLRRHLDGFVVAGTTLAGVGNDAALPDTDPALPDPDPAPDPTTEPPETRP